MKIFLRKTVLGVSAFALLSLAGCSGFTSSNDRDPESILVSNEGNYRSAEHGDELSPEEIHARARAQVEPTKMVQHNDYVKNADDVKAKQERETRVASVQRDLDVVKKDFKGLKDSIQRADVVSAPAISPASGTPIAHVKGLRTGEYPNKTRLVLDMDAATDFKYEIDNTQNLLVIRLPSAQWNAPAEKVFSSSKIIKAYAAKRAQNGGAVVALKLKGPAKVLLSQKLGKNAAGNYRIFLDVAPL